jgi:hypothetical protein
MVTAKNTRERNAMGQNTNWINVKISIGLDGNVSTTVGSQFFIRDEKLV